MARIRYLKPSFFTNEDLAALPWVSRLAFAGLWTQADREGRVEDRPRRLQAVLFPYDRDVDMEQVLAGLAHSGFIRRYVVAGVPLLDIPTFSKHQRPRADEPASELSAWEMRDQAPADEGPAGDGGGAAGPSDAALAGAPPGVPSKSGAQAEESSVRHSTVADPSLRSDGSVPCVRGNVTHQRIGIGIGIGIGNGDRNTHPARARAAPASPAAPDPPRRRPTRHATLLDGPHVGHAHCDVVCVPAWLHAEFRQGLNRPDDPDGADAELRAGYGRHCETWPPGKVTGDPVRFWRAWFAATYPAPTARELRGQVEATRIEQWLNRETAS